MKHLLFLLFLPVLLFGQPHHEETTMIKNVMQLQQDAWNRADIESFMEGYWKSDSLKFIGRNGINYGWQTTLENYKKGYPTPEAMGKLTFTILSLELLSDTSAYLIGRWHLKRANDEPGGHFTLLWRKINGKWVIVADHTS
ncbi:MAG: nuclear transport factor 2 family protein [Cyclobacteriaceae bacterium]|nr:nuclear transport factor 2 family protein [Cyclobacteriaceae bacterium]